MAYRVARAVCLVLLVGAFAACGSDSKSSGGGSASVPVLPQLLWASNGGDDPSGTGGNAGSFLLVAGTEILRDDGRTRPTPGTNVLDWTSSTLTYADLETAVAPLIAADHAVFSLTAAGLRVPSGRTLDLGDGVPSTVNRITIAADQAIVIAGTLLLQRSGTGDSLSVELVSAAGVVHTGHIEGLGTAAIGGADLSLESTGGSDVFVLGSIDVSGGVGMSGGSVELQASGALLLANYGFSTIGGAPGGDGGMVSFEAPSFGSRFVWGADVSGSGEGGSVQILHGDSRLDIFARFIANGGSMQSAAGEDAGSVEIRSALTATTAEGEITGVIHLTANGGSSMSGSGGFGGALSIHARVAENLTLLVEANGGSSADGAGRTGGRVRLWSRYAENVSVGIEARGGDGGTSGGMGGAVEFRVLDEAGLPTDMRFDAMTVVGDLRGGHGDQQSGGDGGHIYLLTGNLSGGQAEFAELEIRNSFLHGGDGQADGGVGGHIHFTTVDCPGRLLIHNTTIDGGDAFGMGSASGTGGTVWMTTGTHAFDVDIDTVSMNGGSGVFGQRGGLLEVKSTGGAAGDREMTIRGLSMRGGNATGQNMSGGLQGELIIETQGTEQLLIHAIEVDMRGGDSDLGNGGGQFNSDVVIEAAGGGAIGPGFINTSGGNGGLAEGGHNGGAGMSIELLVRSGTLEVHADLIMIGGGGSALVGSGGQGGRGGSLNASLAEPAATVEATLIVHGDVLARGGETNTSGDGANGGNLQVTSGTNVTTPGGFHLHGTFDGRGANGLGNNGGMGGNITILLLGDVTVAGAIHLDGGDGQHGANAGTMSFICDGDLLVSGTITANGGEGNSGGDGGIVNLGNDVAATLTLTATAFIQANGGDGNTNNAGTVVLNPVGTGGAANPNLIEEPGSFIETRNGDGTDEPGNIFRD